MAAASVGEEIGAVVSRGGRPDLAGDALPKVRSPTLLIVGGLDYPGRSLRSSQFQSHAASVEANEARLQGRTRIRGMKCLPSGWLI